MVQKARQVHNRRHERSARNAIITKGWVSGGDLFVNNLRLLTVHRRPGAGVCLSVRIIDLRL